MPWKFDPLMVSVKLLPIFAVLGAMEQRLRPGARQARQWLRD
jgi:hypothetical protein